MKLTYDKEADAAYIYFQKGKYEVSSDIIDKGIIVDFDKKGRMLGIEILDASKKFSIETLKKLTFKKFVKK
ncbi:MAG: DUF2283 domain-containing protein [archaeon]|nr:DUF2283 domain-containing protein [archaeon]